MNQTDNELSPVECADLLSSAIEVSKCAAHLADIVKTLMESREHTLPIFMDKFGQDSVIRQAREAHWLMESLGEYLNGCDAITEEDAVWDATFEKARSLFPLDNANVLPPAANETTMKKEIEKQMPVGSDDLFCPDCGRKAEQDHNSFQCHRCEKLWPKGAGWEVRSTAGEITELRLALRNVMAAVGMFETQPIPATGRCGECYGTTVAPGVHKCRNCAKEAALKLLGQNS